jgi:hypothetical protein
LRERKEGMVVKKERMGDYVFYNFEEERTHFHLTHDPSP